MLPATLRNAAGPIPFGEYGYGKTMNWHFYAIKKASKTNEKCEHFDCNSHQFHVDNVLINMTKINEMLGGKISFRVSCAKCPKLYILTSQKLTNKFIKFYGL